ncbi:MAG: folate-binding protein [Rhodobacteraceae bacterium]|nr:folate-binding protein [Paracoccaceae bacterium]
MTSGFLDDSRSVIMIEGPDAENFLQGLLTNDISRASANEAIYAAMLSPQGKFLFDTILYRPAPERFLADVVKERAQALITRLSMYKLRAKVEIKAAGDLSVWVIQGERSGVEAIETAAIAPDPRQPALGWRAICSEPPTALPLGDPEAYARACISLGVPLSGADLKPDDSFPLDADFERLNGVDFQKGCYVGQEVTARMKHKTERRKRLYRIEADPSALAPGAVITSNGKDSGFIGSTADGAALAVMRVDRAENSDLSVGGSPATATAFD